MSSTATERAGQLYRDGRLAEAVSAAGAAVRAAVTEAAPRLLLAELLLFEGALERAETVLDAAVALDPGVALPVAEFRQLLRAEVARRQVRHDGRVPEFLEPPTPALRAALAARVALRGGATAAAAGCAAEVEALRPRVAGRIDGKAFDDLRDACDLHAGFVDVLTPTGKYFWIPTERIARIEFHPPQRPRDLYWRRASMAVRDGPDGDVYVPATYDAQGVEDAALRLGRATDWRDLAGLVIGVGQRTWLLGNEASTVQALTTLEFAA